MTYVSAIGQNTEESTAPPLTDRSIKNWANGFEAIQEWAQKNSAELEAAYGADGNTDDYQAAWAAIQARTEKYEGEVNSLIRKNGFDSTEEWSATGERIMSAFAAIVAKDQMGSFAKQMEASIAQMKSLGMSDEQIEELQKELDKVTKEQWGDVPEADIKVVKKNLDVVKEAVEYYTPEN